MDWGVTQLPQGLAARMQVALVAAVALGQGLIAVMQLTPAPAELPISQAWTESPMSEPRRRVLARPRWSLGPAKVAAGVGPG